LDEHCYLLLAGTGSMQEQMIHYVEKENLQHRVIFLGELKDVRPLLAASNIKVLASLAETFSMAMLEAMAMAVPVISTNIGGSGEAIEDGKSGVLVTPERVGELAEKLNKLVCDEVGRGEMGRVARETVVENFSYSKMIERSAAKLIEVGVGAR